jgi:hypothetical protein
VRFLGLPFTVPGWSSASLEAAAMPFDAELFSLPITNHPFDARCLPVLSLLKSPGQAFRSLPLCGRRGRLGACRTCSRGRAAWNTAFPGAQGVQRIPEVGSIFGFLVFGRDALIEIDHI